MLFKLSKLNSNLALTLGYVNPALTSSTQSLYHENDQLYRFVLSILQYFYFVYTYIMFGQIFNF